MSTPLDIVRTTLVYDVVLTESSIVLLSNFPSIATPKFSIYHPQAL